MEYIEQAKRTESNYLDARKQLGENYTLTRLLHGGMGLATEASEFLDQLKKVIFYNKPLDVVNLKEEVGDLFWYIAIICDELGVSFEDLQKRNIEKLKTRYPNKFESDKALKRDLEKERKVLEK